MDNIQFYTVYAHMLVYINDSNKCVWSIRQYL